jgi:multisubunit Na+/H+ antiporter MnhC subunit
MLNTLRQYLLVFLFGFIATFGLFVFVRFTLLDVIYGFMVASLGGAAAMVLFFVTSRKSRKSQTVYDRDGNPVRR